jgi:PKD repeat protein
VFYSVEVNGNDVTFTKQSTGAISYKWDFGDGTQSTDESPTHTYPGKGKYVPTLYATSSDGMTAEASTVLHISKTSPVKLDDHSLADWDTITTNMVVGGADAGNFIKLNMIMMRRMFTSILNNTHQKAMVIFTTSILMQIMIFQRDI